MRLVLAAAVALAAAFSLQASAAETCLYLTKPGAPRRLVCTDGAVGGSGGCTVSVGSCAGSCTVSVGACGSNGSCIVNVGVCDNNELVHVL